jgi:glycosyltransferase involved in cell wall biosynthesis
MNQTDIVFILPAFEKEAGSHFAYTYAMVQELQKKFRVEVLVERGMEDPRSMFGPNARVLKSASSLSRFPELLLRVLRARWRGAKWVYTHYSFYGGIAGWLITKAFGGTSYYWNCGMPWLYRRSWVEERIFRFVLRHNILVTGTEGLKKEYRDRYLLRTERIRVIPNWIDVKDWHPELHEKLIRDALGIKKDTELILFAAHLSRRKGADLIPGIAAEITAARPHAMVVVAGDGPERASLAEKTRANERVRLLGRIPNRDLIPWFQAADVFVLPSEEEGFPHTLLEAMATGTAVAASSVGGIPDVVPSEYQYELVSHRTAKNFSERIEALLDESDSKRKKRAEALVARAEIFKIERIADQFRTLFR